MSGYNLATYRAHVLQEIEGFGGLAGSSNLSDRQIFTALNEAQRQIQERLRLLQDFLVDIAVVSGTRSYALDASIHGRAIRGVWLRPDTGSEYGKLSRISYPQALEDGLIQDTATTGAPTSWCVDEATPGRMLLLPTPNVSLATALQIHVDASPRTLAAIFDYSDGTALANTTWGSNHVVLTAAGGGALAAATVVAGHEFGVLTTDLNDRTDLPKRWFEIESLDEDLQGLTLRSAYDGATATGQTFISAQMSDLERAHPGKLGFAMADLACALLRDVSMPEEAAVWRARANEILDGFRRDERGETVRGRRTGRTCFLNE